jgi:predicted RNA polymerase sigma factor
MTDGGIEDLLRPLVPQVLGTLVRRYGDFSSCEDAVADALLDASVQWPRQGVPANPKGWLITVAVRRLTDQWRSESARRRREVTAASLGHTGEASVPGPADEQPPDTDDTLTLLFLCCHPALSPPSQIALTLRAVGGLTTAEIARAFLVPEATMAQRISRAKAQIRGSGSRFGLPPEEQRAGLLRAVLHVLYLMFNEGYTASSGDDLQRADLTAEAIRLTRTVHRLLPDDGEVTGLLALMLLTDARRLARTRPDGTPIPLDRQDRGRWDAAAIEEGVALISGALAGAALGPYQIQAAIAAVHDEAPRAADTDWAQILALYGLLERVAPGPMVTLNRAVAVGMVQGPQAGLAALTELDGEPRVAGHHRLDAVRGHLLELAGDAAAAHAAYQRAARRTTSLPEQRYLQVKAAGLAAPRAQRSTTGQDGTHGDEGAAPHRPHGRDEGPR